MARPRGPLKHARCGHGGSGRSPTHRHRERWSSPLHRLPHGSFLRAGRVGHQHQGRVEAPPGRRHHGTPNHTHDPSLHPPTAPVSLPQQREQRRGGSRILLDPPRGRCGGQHDPLRDVGRHNHDPAAPRPVECTRNTGTATTTKTTTTRACTAARAKEKNARACTVEVVTTAVPANTEKEGATLRGQHRDT